MQHVGAVTEVLSYENAQMALIEYPDFKESLDQQTMPANPQGPAPRAMVRRRS
jgi:hypothetical protein